MPPKKKHQTFKFTAPLERMTGRFAWSYVEFPHDVEKLFGKRGNVRVKGMINGVPVDRALMPTKSGYHIIIIGGDIRRAARIKKVGELVQVEVWLNTEPTILEIPEELSETLGFIPEMKAAWDKLKPGMQRNMCYWVGTAKTTATRAKRVAELLRRFETGYFQVGQGPNARPKKKNE
ncbi:MAG: DUF1905 domain-containing protein [Flavobacteriales bacterium]|nr:DUF1905 domain-containing protein [Flavobacteriales bacterium]